MTLKFRYKPPTSDKSILIEHGVINTVNKLSKTTNNFRFSAAVASFGMLLRDSKFKGDASYKTVTDLANAAKGDDINGYRAEFIGLVKTAELLDK